MYTTLAIIRIHMYVLYCCALLKNREPRTTLSLQKIPLYSLLHPLAGGILEQ